MEGYRHHVDMEVVHQMEKATGTCKDIERDGSTDCVGVMCESTAMQA